MQEVVCILFDEADLVPGGLAELAAASVYDVLQVDLAAG